MKEIKLTPQKVKEFIITRGIDGNNLIAKYGKKTNRLSLYHTWGYTGIYANAIGGKQLEFITHWYIELFYKDKTLSMDNAHFLAERGYALEYKRFITLGLIDISITKKEVSGK